MEVSYDVGSFLRGGDGTTDNIRLGDPLLPQLICYLAFTLLRGEWEAVLMEKVNLLRGVNLLTPIHSVSPLKQQTLGN